MTRILLSALLLSAGCAGGIPTEVPEDIKEARHCLEDPMDWKCLVYQNREDFDRVWYEAPYCLGPIRVTRSHDWQPKQLGAICIQVGLDDKASLYMMTEDRP